MAGVVLGIFLLGYVTGHIALVTFIFKAILLILISITILVTVHELGHFLAAKAFGMRVEVFSIGFPPKLFSFRRGETDYQIGATPLGGYVKIAGMIDESFDRDVIDRQKAQEQAEKTGKDTSSFGPRPWEFRAKPVWQRLIVMVAGVVMNVILGITILSVMKYIYGAERTPMSEIEDGIIVVDNSVGQKLGFQNCDEIISYKGETYTYLEEYEDAGKIIADDAWYEVKRDGKIIRLDMPNNAQNYLSSKKLQPYLFTYKPTSHLTLIKSAQYTGSGLKIEPTARKAGMDSGDRILKLDDQSIFWFEDIRKFLKGKENQEILATVLRGNDTLQFNISLDEHAYLGVRPFVEQIEFSPWGALAAGTEAAFTAVFLNAQGFKNIATKEEVTAQENVMGMFQIAYRFVEAWNSGGIPAFLQLTALLSMILAFINILPIPALDGGHIVFLLIELITRREPSVKVKLVAQQIGILLILALMLFVLGNDIFQLASGG